MDSALDKAWSVLMRSFPLLLFLKSKLKGEPIRAIMIDDDGVVDNDDDAAAAAGECECEKVDEQYRYRIEEKEKGVKTNSCILGQERKKRVRKLEWRAGLDGADRVASKSLRGCRIGKKRYKQEDAVVKRFCKACLPCREYAVVAGRKVRRTINWV